MSARLRQPQPRPPVLRATVASPDPDALTVLIDSFDGDRLRREDHEVVSWPRTPGLLPARGDRCLVSYDDHGSLWVLAGDWTTQASVSPHEPAWRTPAFAAGWTDRGTTTPASACLYDIDERGWTVMRGYVDRPSRTWTTGETMLTLPVGPALPIEFSVTMLGAGVRSWGHVMLNSDGALRYMGSGAAWGAGANVIGVGGVSFWAAVP